jgi:hypothetical protein
MASFEDGQTQQEELKVTFTPATDEKFKFIFVPSNPSEKVQLLSDSKSGGLENDALRKRAEAYFQSKAIDNSFQMQEMAKQLAENGMGDVEVTEAMKKFGNAASGNVEIITLGVPHADNGYVSVSIYCDGNSRFRTGGDTEQPNMRATLLAQSCGHKDLTIMGDCFVGRAHDDERVEWQRMDFTEPDMLPTSVWARHANVVNSTKNMSSYSTSGIAQSFMDKQKPKSVEVVTEIQDEVLPEEGFWWTQDQEEIEVRMPMPAGLLAKSLLCNIRPNNITIGNKRVNPTRGSEVPGVNAKFTAPDGAVLGGEVKVEDCTWSIGQEGSGRVLTVTLAKKSKKHWKSLLA